MERRDTRVCKRDVGGLSSFGATVYCLDARVRPQGRPIRLSLPGSSMGFNCGIVGLPNVGKSTLFNAVTNTTAAAAANYPFCTIEPNVGRVPVPDPRLETLARLGASAKTVPTQLEIKDIAGLVRGASKGEGLGNKFLGAIREVDAVLEVLRCFEDADVTHVEGSVDPLRDAELVETELLLADLESLERQRDGLVRRARGPDKDAKARLQLLERVTPEMEAGRQARALELSEDERSLLDGFTLLTAKPILYICNVDEASAATGNALTRTGRGDGRGAGRGSCRHLRRDRGRALRPFRGREGGVPRRHGIGGARPQPGDPGRS